MTRHRSSPPRRARRSLECLSEALVRLGPTTRADLAARTGLSRATVSAVVADLLAAGLVRESVAADAPARGRRPGLLQWVDDEGLVAGIDVGHGHVTVAVAGLDATLLAEVGAELGVDTSPDATLATCRRLLTEALSACGRGERDLRSVAVGVPAPVGGLLGDSIDGPVGSAVHGAVLPGWAEVDLGSSFAALVDAPVLLENDANLGALAEHRFGPQAGADDLVYVKVSTGVGAGVVTGGALLRGQRGLAGEIGHVAVRRTGRRCRCGAVGCLETVASLPAIARDLDLARPGLGIDATAVRALLEAGDPGVERAVVEAGRAIGAALAPTVCLLAPAHLVVNGLGERSGGLVAGIEQAVREHAPIARWQGLQVRASSFGDRNELLGAVHLALSGRRPGQWWVEGSDSSSASTLG